MNGGSVGIVVSTLVSTLRLQSSFSVVSCGSVLSRKVGSSCALPMDSMFTSISFAGMSSLIFSGFFFH